MNSSGLTASVLIFCGLAGVVSAEEAEPLEVDFGLELSSAGSVEQAIAAKLFAKTGISAKPQASAHDLGGDWRPFPDIFAFGGGAPKLYRLGADEWTDILAGAISPDVPASAILLAAERRYGNRLIRAGAESYAFYEGRYVPVASITPTAIAPGSFAADCAKNDTTLAILENNGEPASEAAEYCGCLHGKWQEFGMSQARFDAQARFDFGTKTEADLNATEAENNLLFDVSKEAADACAAERGWEREAYPDDGGFWNGKSMSSAASSFFDVCATQDWIVANAKVGTEDRALGLCACLTSTLESGGLGSSGIRLAAALYSGEKSENEVAGIKPAVIEASYAAEAACLGNMPSR